MRRFAPARNQLQRGRGPETAESGRLRRERRGIFDASTGPRSGDRGERADYERTPLALPSFNGAAVRRPRRGEPNVRVRVISMPASTGPRSGDRGEESSCSQRLSTCSSFNGAAVRRPRRGDGVGRSLFDEDASTGPRSGDRGEGNLSLGEFWRDDASTGPRSGDRGEPITLTTRHPSSPLQRGRGPETAEREPKEPEGLPALRGFNGAAVRRPRRGSGGNRGRNDDDGLQRGRGPETAERKKTRTRRRRSQRRFNGAAVRRPRRDGTHVTYALQPFRFNGAAVRRPRRAWQPRPTRALRPCCFNGAAVRRPRRAGRIPATLHRHRAASTGPRSGDRGERAKRYETRSWKTLQRGRGPETAERYGSPSSKAASR
ncbi:MAG: hypothetical protein QOE70_971 [Chthoniobacter sp.]|nr:hypothetical protein [Chthoniobacter sp.]